MVRWPYYLNIICAIFKQIGHGKLGFASYVDFHQTLLQRLVTPQNEVVKRKHRRFTLTTTIMMEWIVIVTLMKT